ncbi:glycerate kinase [Halalkalibacter alkalisediminis]|uniref:Glycerate kinase n=1 Tax=Halalkalibacter alkalisediminis TaxID=935616 RepID=A0ABV6NDU9_9BACI|nr:glycerate kinase [Halalkalibacter alkalisediminis]
MKIIIASDSYKGSLSSIDVSTSMKRGILNVLPNADVECVPLADGGEGTIDALIAYTNGRIYSERVKGPLGDLVHAKWGLLGDKKTAVIEMAEASGLTLINKEQLNPLKATSYGTGQLIKKALDQGCEKIIIGIGGSATNDGGAGMATALGVKFLDVAQRELPLGGERLIDLETISMSDLDPRLRNVEIVVACDVTNPLCGDSGASVVFGPQKGATPEMVNLLDSALEHYAEKIKADLSKDIMSVPGSGAAGGLGAGLMAFLNGSLQLGIDIILEQIHFESYLMDADLIITGEGKTDRQTSFGKVPMGVAIRAKKYGVPVVCISGSLEQGYEDLYEQGISAFFSIVNSPMHLQAAMKQADHLIESTTENVIRLMSVKKS